MADIKRFTGYIAIDGTTHDTWNKAVAHTKQVKIKEALKQFANITSESHPDFQTSVDADGDQVVYVYDLPLFLYTFKDQILAAFNQPVLMREPRPKKPTFGTKAIKLVPEKAAVSKTPAVAPVVVTSSEDDAMTLV